MNCNQYQELMSPYLDGVLNESQCRELENHLHGCAFCREELESLRRTVELLQLWSEEELELPPGFDERLQQRLRQTKPPWYRRLSKSGFSLSIAAAILLLVAFSVYGNNFDIFQSASRQQLRASLSSSPQMAVADNALPETASSAPEEEATMATKGAPMAPEPEPETPATATEMEKAVAADTGIFSVAGQSELGEEAEQPAANGYDRVPPANGSLSSRRDAEGLKTEDQPPSDGQEEISAQVLEQPLDHESTQADQEATAEKEEAMATEVPLAPEDNSQKLEFLWGKDNVMPEVAAWAAQNKMTAGVFKKNFGCRDAYLVSRGEKIGEGYEIRLISNERDEQNTMVVDMEYIEPDPAGPTVAAVNYPYEVFTVPGKTPVKVRKVEPDGLEELTIQEEPPE